MKNLSLSVKLIGSFVIVAFITLVVGFMGWYGAANLSAHLKLVSEDILPGFSSMLAISKELESIRVAQRTLLDPKLSREARQRQYGNVAAALENIKKARTVYESLDHSPEEIALWKQLIPVMEAWMKENDAFFQLSRDLEKNGVFDPAALLANIERFTGDHHRSMSQTANLLHLRTDLEGGDDPTQCAFGKWMATFKTDNPMINESLKAMASSHATFHSSIKKIKELAKSGDMESATAVYSEAMVPAAEKTFGQFKALRERVAMAEGLYEKLNEMAMVQVYEKQKAALALLHKIIALNEGEVSEVRKEAAVDTGRTKTIALAGTTVGSVLALVLGIISALSITRPLNRVIDGLSEGSGQVASASGQVASASQMLAEGASQQAAALEQTSSSIEEMSSMTRQNADNANEANTLMLETSDVVQEAGASMNQLNDSMREVSRASEETFKIIKTIDQIAFQTNLLALNAAVEAARAGEAGAGFAVVADEVRNLAMQAAEAAKNTASLIEGTVNKIRNGSEVVSQANKTFTRVSESSRKVAGLVDEINAASREQAQGIDQISKAIAEMDKVTQQNASSAEESASASEEMRSQAEQMRGFVSGLIALVSGSGSLKGVEEKTASAREAVKAMRPHPQTSLARSGKADGKGNGGGNGTATPPRRDLVKSIGSGHLIPLDEGFGEF